MSRSVPSKPCPNPPSPDHSPLGNPHPLLQAQTPAAHTLATAMREGGGGTEACSAHFRLLVWWPSHLSLVPLALLWAESRPCPGPLR